MTGELKLQNEELKDPLALSNIVKMLKVKGNEYVGSYGVPVPVAARSEAWVCGGSLAEIVGSKPACGIQCCLLPSRGPCVWLFNLPECAVSERDCGASTMRRSWPTGGSCVTEKRRTG